MTILGAFSSRSPAPAGRRLRAALLAVAAGLLAAGVEAAPWVVITEIHYHPPEDDALEFIEILNREPPRLDLTDWSLEGEVEFLFPQDVTLLPGERLVVARDPRALGKRYPRIGRILGPFRGRLDNDGGRVTLKNPAGARVCEVRYEPGGEWPTPPDGAGHTLSIRSPYFDPAAPESWASSHFIGGTPGQPNAPPLPTVKSELLVRKGDEWRYRRGRRPLPRDWNRPDYDDAEWEVGPSGFGYSDNDDATEILDMRNNFSSLFVRKVFEVPDPSELEQLVLRVDFDDGFVAYLNGDEVARANLGTRGQAVRFNEFAEGQHEAGSPIECSLGPAEDLLKIGRLKRGANLLAVQVHNNQIASSDLTLIVELESREYQPSLAGSRSPRLNEVLRDAGGGPPRAVEFIEVFNPGPTELDLEGYYLSDDPARLKKFRLPRAVVEPRGFVSFAQRDLGERLRLKDGELFVALTTPDARRVLDTLRLVVPESSTNEGPPLVARGRYPDGSRDIAELSAPSPGQANTVRTTTAIVINEIMYNPITESSDDEFIELYNRGRQVIALGGYKLRGGVRYTFEDDDRLRPDSYLVIASNPDALRSKYGLSAREVRGPYEGRLSNSGETLTLKDSRGGVVDRVRFADREPWSHWTDGLGSSLELIHPALDNALAASWAASDDRAKAKWQTLAYTKRHRYVMRVQQEFQMMLLADGECFIDDVSVGASMNVIPNGDFSGRTSWSAVGTHERSQRIVQGPTGDREYYHLIAEGRGNPRHNFVALPIHRPLGSGRYRVELKAKWQRGSPLLLTRLAGQSLAQLHRLEVPARLGSPGARNSVYRESPGPAVGTPEQSPITPALHEEVTLTVPISATAKIVSAAVRFRHEDDEIWRSVPLTVDRTRNVPVEGQGDATMWRGTIPPLGEGQVEFYVEAVDQSGATGTFPPDAVKAGAALYAVGLLPHSHLPTYTLLVSDREWRALRQRPTLSNRMARGTLIFGKERIFHGVRFRPRGSPFTRRGNGNWRIVFGADTLDGRRSLTIDAQRDPGLGERLTFWLIDALRAPNSRQQFVSFRILGRGEQGVFEDVEKIDGSFLDRWFGTTPPASGASGSESPGRLLHKVDDYWELTSQGDRQYQEAYFRYRSGDPEDYRWNFPPRANSVSEDFVPLTELIRLLDTRQTPDRVFFKKAHELIAVDQWIRVLAARALSGDWDTIGGTRGKNAFVYRSPTDNLWYLLPWDADLAWGRSYHRISTRKFASLTRLLDSPLNERLFHGYLAYLVRRKLDRRYFAQILEDLEARSGKSVQRYAAYAIRHRDVALSAVQRASRSEFRVLNAQRIERTDAPDRARMQGVAPVLVRRFLLDGIEGEVELEGRERWTAEVPIGPEGGELKLEALDFGGYLVAEARVQIPPRTGALALSEGVVPRAKGRAGIEEIALEGAAAREDRASLVETFETSANGEKTGDEITLRKRQPRRFTESEPTRGRTVTTTQPLRDRRGFRRRPTVTERAIGSPRPPRRRPRSHGTTSIVHLGPALIFGAATALTTLYLLMIAVRRRHQRRRTRSRTRRQVETSWRFDPGPRPASPSESPPSGVDTSRGRADPVPPPTVPGEPRTARNRLASPVASALRDLASRDFSQADEALQFLWTAGRHDVAALIGAVVDTRATPIGEIEMAEDGRVLALPAYGEPGIEIRDVAELLLGSALGEPPVDRPRQEDWVAHWRETLRKDDPGS